MKRWTVSGLRQGNSMRRLGRYDALDTMMSGWRPDELDRPDLWMCHLAYAAKFASCFTPLFRDAAIPATQFGDRPSYQMDPASKREALRKSTWMSEGPTSSWSSRLCRIWILSVPRVSERCCRLPPIRVSGEYSMIKAAAQSGWLDERRAMMESLLSIKRAGADIILTFCKGRRRAAPVTARNESYREPPHPHPGLFSGDHRRVLMVIIAAATARFWIRW